MKFPRFGITLPNYGPHASPHAMVDVATAVERLGLNSVSTFDRLLLPASPGWQNVYDLPEWPVYDAIESLTWVAAHTRRIRLATGVVNVLFQSPVILARRLATVDQLSRLEHGCGGALPQRLRILRTRLTLLWGNFR